MSLFTIVITIVVVGVLLWLVNNYIPMDRKIKNVLNILVVIITVVWLLKVFGVLDYMSRVHVENQMPSFTITTLFS
jgi:hypothetical protein